MIGRIVIAALVLLFWVAAAPADMIVNVCGPAKDVMDTLKKYREICGEPVAAEGRTILFCKNDLTGTWTIIGITPQATCERF